MELNQGILAKISREAKVNVKQTEATLVLLEDQATVPFIARYRKDVTGNLDEVQIRTIAERHEYYKELLARRMTILKSIEEQGKLTEDLKNTILACYEKNELEDLYLPYKPKLPLPSKEDWSLWLSLFGSKCPAKNPLRN